MDEEEEIRIGVYVCHCGLNIGATVDCEEVAEHAKTLDDVVYAEHQMYTCSEPGQQQRHDHHCENQQHHDQCLWPFIIYCNKLELESLWWRFCFGELTLGVGTAYQLRHFLLLFQPLGVVGK